MGIIATLKKIFNKNIECGMEADGKLVYPYPNSSRVVHIDSNIVVGSNHWAVFVCNDKVCDVLDSGKHKISMMNLPEACEMSKVSRPKKNGKFNKKFKADIYYVSKERFNLVPFASDEKFFIRSSQFGKIKGYTEGKCTLTVTQPAVLIDVMLADRYAIKERHVNLEKHVLVISDKIGNAANRVLERNREDFSNVLLNPNSLCSALDEEVTTKMYDCGVKVSNVEITSFRLNKKLTEQVAEFIVQKKAITDTFAMSGISYDNQAVVPTSINVESGNVDASSVSDVVNVQKTSGAMQVDIGSDIESQSSTMQMQNNAYNKADFNAMQTNEAVPIAGHGQVVSSSLASRMYNREKSMEVLYGSQNSTVVPSGGGNAASLGNTQVVRRGGSAVQPSSVAGSQYVATNINVESIVNSGKKVCKFCGKTIESHYAECPFCKFKQ